MSQKAVRARALPVLALLLGAVETVLVRMNYDHRPRELSLFLQASLIWLVFLLLAWFPAGWLGWLVLRRRVPSERDRAPLGPVLVLLFCAVSPVVAHHFLDRHTTIGGDTARLLATRPWLEALAGVAILALLLAGVARVLSAVPRGLLFAGGLVLAVATGLFTPSGPEEGGRAEGQLGNAASQPNLLLIVLDTTRAASVQPFGANRETTPHLAKLAEESLVYTNARAVSRYTFSSHLSILTGAYPSRHGARLVDMRYRRDRAEHVAALLREAGYRTGGFVGVEMLSGRSGIDFGFEVWDDRVDPHVCDTRAWRLVHDLQTIASNRISWLWFNGQPHWFQDYQRPAEGPLSAARAWIENGDPRPWFCFVNLYDAHWPYLPGEKAREQLVRPYDGPLDGFVFRSNDYPAGRWPDAEDKRHLTDLYEAEIWELDRAVDEFLSELEPGLGDAGVILTSDHGEAFGEGGRYQHADVLEPQLRVPLLVRHPGDDPPRGRVDLPTSGVDVAPTLLGLAGLDVPAIMDGVDLARSSPSPDRAILSEDRDHYDLDRVRFVLVRGRFRLEVRRLGERQLVRLSDLEADPDGVHDVGDEHPELRDEMFAEIEAMRASWGGDVNDAAMEAGALFDPDALGALGYLEEDGPIPEEDPALAEPAERP